MFNEAKLIKKVILKMQFFKVQNGKDKVNYVPSRKLEGILLQPVIYHTCPMDINIFQVIFDVSGLIHFSTNLEMTSYVNFNQNTCSLRSFLSFCQFESKFTLT